MNRIQSFKFDIKYLSMADRKETHKVIIKAFENVVKKTPDAALMKKKDLIALIGEEPGPKIGDIWSSYTINLVIRNYFKNHEHNKIGR